MNPIPPTDIPTVLYTISEYGEFFSLLDIAKMLKDELGLHPVFLFKAEYGAFDTHSRILERMNYSWTTARSSHTSFDARQITPGVSDYLPSSVLNLSTEDNFKAAGGAGGFSSNIAFHALVCLLQVHERLHRRRSAKRQSNGTSQL